MTLHFHPEAKDDIKTIAEKYADVSPHVHERFWAELDSAVQRIGEFPTRHHFDASGYRRSNLKKFPYHVLFEASDTEIRILVVRHNRRKPSFGLDRE